jgi:hypothetical protein
VVALSGPGDEEEDVYTAVLLGKFPILIGWVQRWTMSMACSCYVGCVLALLLLGGWHRGRKSGEL